VRAVGWRSLVCAERLVDVTERNVSARRRTLLDGCSAQRETAEEGQVARAIWSAVAKETVEWDSKHPSIILCTPEVLSQS
jgi:hypothetical protein